MNRFLTLLAPLVLLVEFVTSGSPSTNLRDFNTGAPYWDWGQRLEAKVYPKETKKAHKKLISQRPFLPFSQVGASAGPFPRNDGTTKSRHPEDTLLPGYLTNGLEEGFTTLDVLQKEINKGGQTISSKIKGGLGGLDPREVYYADDDLLIIKGGGFGGASYQEPLQELSDAGDLQPPTKWNLKHSPSFDEEYNGNMATIVAPPALVSPYWWGGLPAAPTRFSPLSLFLPVNSFAGQESNVAYRYTNPIQAYRMVPQYSLNRYAYYIPPKMYSQRYFGGEGGAFQNAIRPASLKHPRPQASLKYKEALEYPSRRIPSGNELLQGRRPPTFLGDTDVNYLNPRPSINEDAEMISQPRAPK